MDNGFEAFWVAWVEASPEWDDAAGNYRTIAEEAWEQGQATLQAENERLRERVREGFTQASELSIDYARLLGICETLTGSLWPQNETTEKLAEVIQGLEPPTEGESDNAKP